MFIITKKQRVNESNVYCDYRTKYKKLDNCQPYTMVIIYVHVNITMYNNTGSETLDN